MSKQTKKPCYVYVRVSKEVQADLGQGIKRQKTMAMQFLANYPQYEVVEVFEDKGKSASYSRNTQTGSKLGDFLQRVEEGAYIFQLLKSKHIWMGICKYNLLIDPYDKNNMVNSMQVMSGLWMGHEESKQKSLRINKTFDFKSEDARKNKMKFKTRAHPSWLGLNAQGDDFIINAEKAKVIKKNFELRVFMKYGTDKIARWLNDNNIPPVKKVWSRTSIKNILSDISVVGLYQPQSRKFNEQTGARSDEDNGSVIANYYPVIIDRELFDTVKLLMRPTKQNKQKMAGRLGSYKNILRKIAKCYNCGGALHFKQRYLICANNNLTCVIPSSINIEKYAIR